MTIYQKKKKVQSLWNLEDKFMSLILVSVPLSKLITMVSMVKTDPFLFITRRIVTNVAVCIPLKPFWKL